MKSGKQLTDIFKYIENTNNLFLYKLGNYYIPQGLSFPKAKQVTVINCNSTGITNMLRPSVFPNVNTINYLSAHPGSYDIHKQFRANTKWFFPNKTYVFYNYMVSIGKGIKDENLIRKCISSKKIVDGQSEFDISLMFDLNLPNYASVDGEWYREQFYEYLHNRQMDINNVPVLQEAEEQHLQKEYVKKCLEEAYMESIINGGEY